MSVEVMEPDRSLHALIAARDDLRQRVLAVLAEREAYSVEVAKSCGVSYREARSALSWLRRRGYIEVARFEPAPKSGLGRNYYKPTGKVLTL